MSNYILGIAYVWEYDEDFINLIEEILQGSNITTYRVADYNVKEVAIAGGVSANSGLRNAMQKNVEKLGWNVYIPKFEYTTDNAAMIAMVAKLKFERGEFTDLRTSATARYDM